MTIAAPFRALECSIKPEWLSANTSHLFVANYVTLFNEAIRNFFEAHGLGQAYKDTHHQHYVFAGLAVRYEREIFGGDTALINIILADTDEKRAHLAMEMHRAGDPKRICFAETLNVNASRATGRSTSWSGGVGEKLLATKALHDALPRPKGFGQGIGINHK
jgi:acyl-CoA thioesterase FadM